MEERKEPEFIKWAKGDVVEGVLTGIDKIHVADQDKPNAPKRPVTKFTVEMERGKFVSFLGSYDLVTKLRIEDKGHMVSITYLGEDETIQRNGNAMKKFKVMVSQQSLRHGAASDSTLITDEDIPF